MGKKTNLYKILGVEEDATQEEIKKAYRSRAMKVHPDTNPDNPEEAAECMAELSDAYEILSDPDRRAEYDERGVVEGSLHSMYDVANDILTQCFADLLQTHGPDGLLRINVVKCVRGKFKNGLDEQHTSLKKAKLDVKKLRVVRGRICHPEEENAFSRVIDTSLHAIEKYMEQTDGGIRALNLALELLDQYEFIHDEEQSGWGGMNRKPGMNMGLAEQMVNSVYGSGSRT